MNNKAAKKLRKLAALLTQTKPQETKTVYRRLKSVHKDNKKEI